MSSFVRKLMCEVVGYVPYETQITDLLKVVKDKHALKVVKRRLKTYTQAKRKHSEMIGDSV
ncbi:hypothetical protein KP509_24G081700 [Ceratopteris richardii]|uniref:60S ribosomal protein L36 n=1 Tax=Ceratopteris richardii TaxID=49495 RepID=A0A8T2RWJ3_CERRI|nr:hypothetical protein KP509_24G081500 [Ceratopteris richardii]KAH7300848.1 hypothetical protein KP509_24G081700 [Ceratopteris richardii]